MSPEPEVGPATSLAGESAATLMAPGLAITRAEAIAGGPSPLSKALPALAWISLGWLVLVCLLALLAPVLPIPNPNTSLAEIARQGPSAGHWFGGDSIGRDMFARVIWGARNSLVIGFGAIALGLLVGVPLGLVAGYLRGFTDSVVTFILDVLLSVPAIIFAAAIAAFYGRSTQNVILAIGIIALPTLARIVRANTIVYAQREFVTAARALGATHWRIMWREVFPNVVPATVAIAMLGVAVAIVVEGALSILGTGLPNDAISWGSIISFNLNVIAEAPNTWIFPSLCIFITVVALNTIGDAVRQKFDVREGAL
ncbi:MAG: ABC transporter permease [Acidimicrobiia bacterium]